MSKTKFAGTILGLAAIGVVGSSCTALVGSFDGPGGTGGGAPGTGGMANSGGMTAGTMHTSSSSHTGTGAMTGTSTTATTTTTGTMSSVGGGGSAQGGGGSTSSSSGGGGGGPVGACTDMSDELVLQMPGFSIANVIGQCVTDPNVASCIATQAHLSAACSACFADIFQCTFDHCPNECNGGASSAACFQCQSANGCITALETCAGPYCKAGQTNACLGSCTDLDTDPNNCGSCGKSCGTAAAVTCSGGSCLCKGTACSGACCDIGTATSCVDTTKDSTNCGACGLTCGAGNVCVNSKCTGNCAQPNASCDATAPCCTGNCDASGKCPSSCTPPSGPCTVGSDCCSQVCQSGGRCGPIPYGGSCNAVTSQYCTVGTDGQLDCVGGVCCDSACTGACMACTQAETNQPDGHCAPSHATGCCGDTTSDPANCGACGHSCQGGACKTSQCQPFTVSRGSQSPYGVAAVLGTDVAWTSFISPGNVTSCPVTGCAGSPPGPGIPFAMGEPNPYFIAFDPPSKTAFWTDFNGGRVMRAQFLGGAWTGPTQFASTMSPTGIAINHALQLVVWVAQGPGNILSANVSGGPVNQVALGQNSPSAITVDDQAVYWTNTNGNSVMSCPFPGSCGNNPINLTQFVPPGLVQGPFGIGVDGQNVYWANQRGGTVVSCPLSGCGGLPPKILVSNLGNPGNLVVDAQGIYWTNELDGTVMQCTPPACASGPRILAQSQNSPRGIAVDANSIYWANFNDGTVMKVAR